MSAGISIHALREEGDFTIEDALFGKIKFLSTPSARRATAKNRRPWRWLSHVYPRPPRGGRPCPALAGSGQVRYFYPRPPRGGRLTYARMGSALMLFLSTPSARRATCCRTCRSTLGGNFYPRPPRGGRHNDFTAAIQRLKFLSTPSVRRATDSGCLGCSGINISIHALREEGDQRSAANGRLQ